MLFIADNVTAREKNQTFYVIVLITALVILITQRREEAKRKKIEKNLTPLLMMTKSRW